MPIYEYQCESCEHEFDTLQKLSEEPLKTCPSCGQDALRKKISAAGFRLKGGGWYETDFKGGKRKNVSGEDKGSASDSDASSKSSDSATKTETPKSSADSGGSSAAGGGKAKSGD